MNSSQKAILRNDTPGVSHRNHLNNAGSALMPKPVLKAITDHLNLETEIGGYEAAWQEADRIKGFYTSTAQLLGCDSHNVAFMNSATDAYNKALSSINFGTDDYILTTENDYTSNQIAFIALSKRFGVDIKRVPNKDYGLVDPTDIEQQIKTKAPKLVAISHVATNSGAIQPVQEIGVICRKHDILYLVDACQSLGQLTVNPGEIGCDFLSGTMRKFMRGPRGAGLLFVSDRVLDKNMEPLFGDMVGALWTGEKEFQIQERARRFEEWEKSYGLMLGSKAAVDYILEVGIETIEKEVRHISDYARKGFRSIEKTQVIDDGENLCGVITIANPDWNIDQVKEILVKNKINFDISLRENAIIHYGKLNIDWALRISPHYYNTEEEIDELNASLGHISVR